MKTTTMRLDDEMAEELALVARMEGVSVAEILRRAVGREVRERLSDPALRARLAREQAEERGRLEHYQQRDDVQQ